MLSHKRRMAAFWALMGIAGLFIVPCLISASFSKIEKDSRWLKSIRAWRMGAQLTNSEGVVLQRRANDCGPAALNMILDSHGIHCKLANLASALWLTPKGTSMLNLRMAAAGFGISAKSWRVHPNDLRRVPLPAIAFINKNHFVVIRRFIAPRILEVDDPALGRLHWPLRAFQRVWSGETLVFDPDWSPHE